MIIGFRLPDSFLSESLREQQNNESRLYSMDLRNRRYYRPYPPLEKVGLEPGRKTDQCMIGETVFIEFGASHGLQM